MLLTTVHGGFHVLFIMGLTFASITRVRAALRLRRVLRRLSVSTPNSRDAFGLAAAGAGLACARVRVLEGAPVPAFTAGWFSLLVYVDRALEGRLSADELAAVLAYEAAHVARRDPLRLSLLRFLAQLLFWVPALRRIADDAADETEVAADDCAAQAVARARVVAMRNVAR